jgi:hypothetical protein
MSKQITKKDIEEILHEYLDDDSRMLQGTVNQLLSLISQHENWIIGEDEDHKGDRWERGRNNLREEQRKRKLNK